ncbi:hypothetical protein C1H46_034824 [Malus baccata]|uniref:UDP N-acetylglucosamine O-acyltransferase C-terminal domain-containing protein n=1 Tax=Malus baccata TaxID=106549 RepID=A0A540KZU6_MALBA|nr:hypothetical protein C1H46_034824 [Malus baccata]
MRALVKVGGKRLSSALSSLSSPSLLRLCSTLNSGSVHPTAIVHPNAVLGQGVSIGPFCTVGSSAKVGNGCRLYPGSHVFGNTEVGERCVLMTGAIVGDDLPGRTVLGCDNVIGHHAVVGVKCQDLKYKSGDECFLDVGDNNDIRDTTVCGLLIAFLSYLCFKFSCSHCCYVIRLLGITILSWDLVILPTIARSETTSFLQIIHC